MLRSVRITILLNHDNAGHRANDFKTSPPTSLAIVKPRYLALRYRISWKFIQDPASTLRSSRHGTGRATKQIYSTRKCTLLAYGQSFYLRTRFNYSGFNIHRNACSFHTLSVHQLTVNAITTTICPVLPRLKLFSNRYVEFKQNFIFQHKFP